MSDYQNVCSDTSMRTCRADSPRTLWTSSSELIVAWSIRSFFVDGLSTT